MLSSQITFLDTPEERRAEPFPEIHHPLWAPRHSLRTNALSMDVEQNVAAANLDFSPRTVETLQVKLGMLCKQVCKHCHVDAGRKRAADDVDGMARRAGSFLC
jgi:hypothetical protein